MAEKVFIDFKNVAAFACPECGKSWKKDLTPLMDRINNNGDPMKFKYPCGHSFSVIFDKRRHLRKAAELTGAFVHERSQRRGIIEVKNISKSGIGFDLNSKQFMHVGDRLALKFNLDDLEMSFVYEEGIVKKIEGNYVGVEFCEFRHREALEAYVSD
ncbi:MAG: PilZ domain-containing protein [Desulfobacterales bacterium]|nr:PilZ domain-containing protein [Desulfobacterales bacterium]